MTFIDGTVNTPGCQCDLACGMPCWQRAGLTDAPCSEGHEPCGTHKQLAAALEDDDLGAAA